MSTGQFLPVQQPGTSQFQSFEGAGNIITRRFIPLNVLSIDHVSVINKKVIEEDRQSFIQGQMRNLRGTLTDADLKVTFSIGHQLQESQLAALIMDEFDPFNKTFNVKIGFVSTTAEQYLASQLPASEPRKFAVVIPFVRGLNMQKPLIDRMGSMMGTDVLHVLVQFWGFSQPLASLRPTWRIRLRVDQLNNQIVCVSVNSALIDVSRVQETAKTLTSWMWMIPNRLTSWMRSWQQTGYLGPSTGMQQQQLYSSGATSGIQQQAPLSSGLAQQQPLSQTSMGQQPLSQQSLGQQPYQLSSASTSEIYHPGGY